MFNLEIDNISLSYDHRLVVKGLSFRIGPGQLVGLIGPNGCGKTSIIKAIGRSLVLRSGKIMLNQKDLTRFSRNDLARIIGVVPQNPALPDTFTVSEVVLLGRNPHLGLLRNESSRDMAITWLAMERTGITGLAERPMGELSGGERQRVTIARVLAQEPQAMLLDEPTANLDINNQIEILDLIQGLCQERKLAVLIALHDLNLASQYCHRILMIKEGRIFAEGTPAEIVTSANIKEVYGTESFINFHPENGLPVVIPASSRSTSTKIKGGD